MMRGRCETHCRGIGTADLAACEHVLPERKNLILPMDANITLLSIASSGTVLQNKKTVSSKNRTLLTNMKAPPKMKLEN